MIQQKELRVGNYVNVPSLSNELYEISTISRYGRDCSVTDNKLGYQSDTLDIENVNPIPFSHDTLVQIADSVEHFHDGVLIYKFGKFNVYQQKGIFWVSEGLNGYDKDFKHVKTIHQLQNLYYAINGKDLTIKELSPAS